MLFHILIGVLYCVVGYMIIDAPGISLRVGTWTRHRRHSRYCRSPACLTAPLKVGGTTGSPPKGAFISALKRDYFLKMCGIQDRPQSPTFRNSGI